MPRAWIVVGLIAAAVAGGLLPLIVNGSDRVGEVAMSIAVLGLTLGPLLWSVAQRRFDLFEPIVSASVMLALLFGVRPLYVIGDGSYQFLGKDISHSFSMAVALGLAGTVAFVGAYWLYRPKPSRRPGESRAYGGLTSAAILIGVPVALLGAALFAVNLLRMGPLSMVIPLWLGGKSDELLVAFKGNSEYLSAAPILASCAAVVIGCASGWHLARSTRILIILLVAFPVLVFSVGGDRRFLIPSMGVPLVAYFLSTNRRPGRLVLVASVPVMFAVLVTIPLIRTSGGREQAGGVVPAITGAVMAPLEQWDHFITSYDTDMVESLSVEVGVLRDDFFYGGATIGDLLIAPIPSSLFPDKPTTARDQMLIKAYGSPCTFGAGGLCPDFSAIGTFYQDFSWPGVLFGMALLGAMSRAVWARYMEDPRSVTRVIVAATWCVSLPIIIRAGVMPALAWWLYFLLPSLAIARLAQAMATRFPNPRPTPGRGPLGDVTGPQTRWHGRRRGGLTCAGSSAWSATSMPTRMPHSRGLWGRWPAAGRTWTRTNANRRA
jgi:hypothetical protein